MKLKLLLLVLFVTVTTFGQNWSQVGTTQFTNFASDAVIATDPSTGDPYVAIVEPLSSSKISVKKFDGTNWVSQGTLVGENAINIALAINPINNQPVVAYRDTTDSTLYAYTFDGTAWSLIMNYNVTLKNHKVQIQFNAAGDMRFSGHESNDRLVVVEKKISGPITKYTTPKYYGTENKFDFNAFNKYYIANRVYQSRSEWEIHKISVDRYGITDFTIRPRSYGGGTEITLKNISGISDNDFVAAFDVSARYNSTTGITEPANEVVIYNNTTEVKRIGAVNDIVQFRKNFVNNQLYVMYAEKNSADIAFQSYNSITDSWSNLPTTSIDSNSSANFFINMAIDKIDGSIYVVYLDGSKASVKKFTIIKPANQSIIYVDKNSPNVNGNGSSWANANPSLQSALQNITSLTEEIWVAKGTYYASTTDRSESFNIISNNNLKLYGGFDGSETSISERDISSNPTILSGDLNNDDSGALAFNNTTMAENTYNIVKVSAEDVLLDGFTITNANANGSTQNEQEGSAITLLPTVKNFVLNNSTISNNINKRAGSIKSIDPSANVSILFSNSIFKNNLAAFANALYSRTLSGKILNFTSVNMLYDSNIIDNVNGSGVFWFRNDHGACTVNAKFINDTFVNNTGNRVPSAGNDLPVITVGQTKGVIKTDISNSIFWNNTDGNGNIVPALGRNGNDAYPDITNMLVSNSLDSDGFSKVTYKQNIITSDPLFTSATDFSLQANSPAINMGDNSKVPADINADILGNTRIFDTTVDLGAYEFGASAVAGLSDINKIAFSVYPNPTVNVLNIKLNEDIKLAEIYNLQGQKVLFSKLKTINTSKLSNGIYLLKITTTDNNIGLKRFVKE
ncbi:T9SS type A sorting domain-containing protein [Polaribacter marinaquae]|uniref:T9SS type A sorting domain-containing protein n=1 Tax=Polaribacter marinaquae TaxID=1642819 RepID=A0ABZ2TR45_9FLAO